MSQQFIIHFIYDIVPTSILTVFILKLVNDLSKDD
ncbi:hypothetical protein T296_03895 [Pantoea agglomerans Eh318]|nr:hypothetical protein T296_03895 [Pantoea agglomerans Eh318]